MLAPALHHFRRYVVVGQGSLEQWWLTGLLTDQVMIDGRYEIGYVFAENLQHFLTVSSRYISPLLQDQPARFAVYRHYADPKQFIQHGAGRHVTAVALDQFTETARSVERQHGWLSVFGLETRIMNPT